jgi:integrase
MRKDSASGRGRSTTTYLIVERHIIPALGKHRLDRLSPSATSKLGSIVTWARLGPFTTTAQYFVGALNVAVRQRLVDRNVAVSVELPEAERFRGSPLTLDEARRLLSVTAGDRLSPLWWVAIDTGLRIGELLALGWNHVDLEAGTLRVEGQLQRRDGRWERTPPKAARSLDVVSLSAETVAALRRHRLEQASERLPTRRISAWCSVRGRGCRTTSPRSSRPSRPLVGGLG